MAKNPSADLHVHSCHSDGRLHPADLAARAAHNQVAVLAVTDHDTLNGEEEKAEACRRLGIEYVTGVEISCHYNGREAHVLSLFADPDSPYRLRLGELQNARERRMLGMLEKLARLGIRLTPEDLPSGAGSLGRPHLARALVAKGRVKSVSEAFGRYLYDNGPVYIPKTRLTVAEGVDLAKHLGGVAILAHPGASGLLDGLDAFRAVGIDGVEAYHPKHGGGTVARILDYCRANSLLVAGGSDFHAPGESPDIGSQRVPLDLLDPLRDRAARAS